MSDILSPLLSPGDFAESAKVHILEVCLDPRGPSSWVISCSVDGYKSVFRHLLS